MSADKLSDSVKDAIAGLVEANHSLSTAAQQCGVAKSTASEWYARGSESKAGKYKEFYEAINEARDRAEQRLLEKVHHLAENGNEITKERVTYHPDGSQTKTTETQHTEDFAVIRWLLEKRHGFDSAPEKAMEKAVNRILSLSKKQLSEDSFNNLVSVIAHDPVLGNVDFDKDLLL